MALKITWFGHSAFRLDFADKVLLIDPFFTGNPAFEGTIAKASQGVTHILITHDYADHGCDAVALAQQYNVPIITNHDLCQWLAAKGVQHYEAIHMGGTLHLDNFSVSLVRADRPVGFEHQTTGGANGLIISPLGEPSVYHMGDTDIFDDMALIAEIHRPDIAFVPIGGQRTMGPEVAAMAVRRFLKVRAVIPCHYASFPELEPDADRFIAAMEGADCQVVVPHKTMAVRF
jgi:L-ascorbate metabolism protein UlaG (beta-lactamase superfamily)